MPSWSAVGALCLAIAVGTGAFGAHGLRSRLDAYSLDVWEKAVLYHFVHALGLLMLSQLSTNRLVGWLLLVGIVLFSGSLYLLALTGNRMLGAVTPLGGVAFIAAWVILALDLWRSAAKP